MEFRPGAVPAQRSSARSSWSWRMPWAMSASGSHPAAVMAGQGGLGADKGM